VTRDVVSVDEADLSVTITFEVGFLRVVGSEALIRVTFAAAAGVAFFGAGFFALVAKVVLQLKKPASADCQVTL